MKFDKKDVATGLIVLAILAGGYFWLKQDDSQPVPQATPIIEEKIEDSFKVNIPDDVEKVELKDLSAKGVSALATRKFANNKFDAMVLADLSDPATGKFYASWIAKGEEYLLLGKMRVAKGGWISEYTGSKDLSDYSKVVISLESVLSAKPTEVLLEGTFN